MTTFNSYQKKNNFVSSRPLSVVYSSHCFHPYNHKFLFFLLKKLVNKVDIGPTQMREHLSSRKTKEIGTDLMKHKFKRNLAPICALVFVSIRSCNVN